MSLGQLISSCAIGAAIHHPIRLIGALRAISGMWYIFDLLLRSRPIPVTHVPASTIDAAIHSEIRVMRSLRAISCLSVDTYLTYLPRFNPTLRLLSTSHMGDKISDSYQLSANLPGNQEDLGWCQRNSQGKRQTMGGWMPVYSPQNTDNAWASYIAEV